MTDEPIRKREDVDNFVAYVGTGSPRALRPHSDGAVARFRPSKTRSAHRFASAGLSQK